eukprot:scaffold73267_cov67-Phaeocystis_antarctica.AAC.4
MRRHQTGGEGNGAQHLRRCRARVLLARSPGTIDETHMRKLASWRNVAALGDSRCAATPRTTGLSREHGPQRGQLSVARGSSLRGSRGELTARAAAT